jgi:hypothetical protein
MTFEQNRIERAISEQQPKVDAIRKSIASILASQPKTPDGFPSSLALVWGIPHTINGASVVAFRSADAYARQYASASTPPAAAEASAPAEADGSKKRKREEEEREAGRAARPPAPSSVISTR